MSDKKRGFPKFVKIILLVVFVIGITVGYIGYSAFLGPSVTSKESYLYVHSEDNYHDVLEELEEKGIVKNIRFFDYVARVMDYPTAVKPGRYKLSEGLSNRRLIGNLRGGYQEAVKFRFENIRLKENFAGLLGKNFEADSLTFLEILDNEDVSEKYGFTEDNFFSMFIPNTYEIYWNTSPDKIVARFHDEYIKFWNAERKEKAAALNLTPQEVSVLASIVKGEALHKDEMPKIAGLYLNRLKRGILLQADPTVIFAQNDFTIRRVLNRHLTIDNPYNTYRFKGLPPGPIMLPSIAAIDAVLNYAKHDYIYMCAKDDFSGYHNFAVTQAEHLVNARKFQRALDARNIKK
ncbi:endolytic transglycosylase MltG [Sphingobacterium deserti]|uniref:Endolytic murein transglycosylase n=1 Tax=Sphingobacterium deserti TaxID=1229276 RepID=A0A0B8T9R7_9SPHI|nr:endolytic transglycosylase MltG [Sphingobacterium deserti]KGE15509.1 aminodeoxychorismate lyase [Sphingobacterium deserti]